MSKGRHGRAFHRAKKKKKARKQRAEPVKHQAIAGQPVEPGTPVIEGKIAPEPANMAEKPALKQERNTAMIADLKMVAILAAIMLVVLIVLAQLMG